MAGAGGGLLPKGVELAGHMKSASLAPSSLQ